MTVAPPSGHCPDCDGELYPEDFDDDDGYFMCGCGSEVDPKSLRRT